MAIAPGNNMRIGQVKRWNRLLTLWLWTALCGGCMAIMLLFAAQKTIVIEDSSMEGNLTASPDGSDRTITFVRDENLPGRLCIPLKSGWKADKVSVENRYMDRELWIRVEGGDSSFFVENNVSGDISRLAGGSFGDAGGGVLLKIRFQEAYEFRSILEERKLYIEFLPPGRIYERIVVIDAGGTDSLGDFSDETEKYSERAGNGRADSPGDASYNAEEKQIALAVAEKLRKNLEKQNIKVYLATAEDSGSDRTAPAKLANEVQADLFIGIGTSEKGEDPEAYGIRCLYNGTYFIPDFGNVELADLLVRNTVTAVSGRAEGLIEAEENSVLSLPKMPSAVIEAGYLSNRREHMLLTQEAYQDKLAQGMAEAVQEAFRMLSEYSAEKEP